jgi:O-antigen ligase
MIFDLGTIGIFLFAALSWGANEPWAMALISFAAILLFAVKLICDVLHGEIPLVRLWSFFPLILFIIYGVFQSLNPIPTLGAKTSLIPYTIEQYSTIHYLILAISYLCLILLVASGFKSRTSIKMLMYSVIILGIFEALYGLVQYLGDYRLIWNYPVTGAIAQGTLINRNHYALLLNLCICCGIGFLYYRSIQILKGQDLTLRRILSLPGSAQLAWFLIWPTLMGIALVFSMSRMGILALFGSVAVMIIVGKSTTGTRRTAVIGITLISLILGLAVYAGIDAVLARYESMTQAIALEQDRIPIWRDSWRMIKEHLISGQGLGTFQWAFPAYETLEPDIPAKYAHNDYLQALAEVGIIGLLLLIWTFVIFWRTAVRNLKKSRDPLARAIGLTLIGALTATALQEITDFSLYIPATATLFSVLAGLNFRAEILGKVEEDASDDSQSI